MSDQNEFSLEGLRMPPCFTDPAALAKIKKRNPDGVTVDPDHVPLKPDPDHDILLKDIDDAIYSGVLLCGVGAGIVTIQNMQFARMRELFGLDGRAECLRWIDTHDKGDPAAVEALLSDAIMRKDPWRLPDELLDEYVKRTYCTGPCSWRPAAR